MNKNASIITDVLVELRGSPQSLDAEVKKLVFPLLAPLLAISLSPLHCL